MFRLLTIALLAGTAVPAAAIAQDQEPAESYSRGGRGIRVAPSADSGVRPERPARVERREPRADAPAYQAQAQPQPQQRPDRGWRGDRGGNGDGRRGWRGDTPATPPPVVAQPQPAPQARRGGIAGVVLGLDRDRGERRDWNRDRDGQRDWNRSDSGRRDGTRDRDDRRNWDRDRDGRRDWNRNDWNRNDGRRDWNDRRWDGNPGWDRGRDTRSWNRGWRSDRRYDWQGYRSSNRYAYRWPQYHAPRGWGYGYRRFDIGTTLFAGLFARDYWIDDPYDYRLPPVDWPFQWVRYYDDALLVDTTTGRVVDLIPGIFWY